MFVVGDISLRHFFIACNELYNSTIYARQKKFNEIFSKCWNLISEFIIHVYSRRVAFVCLLKNRQLEIALISEKKIISKVASQVIGVKNNFCTLIIQQFRVAIFFIYKILIHGFFRRLFSYLLIRKKLKRVKFIK